MEPKESSGSIFDEWDKQDIYQKNKKSVEKKSTDFYYYLFHYAQQKCNMGLEECLDMNIYEFVDYLEFITRLNSKNK
ncbi:hypothetical protein [uncultured Clostridium sp.]|uniref:hypothetical protein n=1 Tax=uncultured Clostridium sp. TaxID=59620 RepID=UPI00262DCFA9|nr:hypothetical protein [uncultured Clostridium sp.]